MLSHLIPDSVVPRKAECTLRLHGTIGDEPMVSMIPDYDERAFSRYGPTSKILPHGWFTGSLCPTEVLGVCACSEMQAVSLCRTALLLKLLN